jgi:hypothetical protein
VRTRTLGVLQFAASTAGIVLPENIGEASETQLKTVLADAVDALKALQSQASVTDEELAEARRLADIVSAAREVLDGRSAEAGARKNELGELLAGLDRPEAPAVEAPAVEAPKAAAVEVAAVEAPKAEAAVEAPRAAEVKNAGGGSELAVAKREVAALIAAPDAVGVAQGKMFADFSEAAQSIIARTAGYPQGPTGSPARFQHGALRIARKFDPSLVAAGYEDTDVMDRAVSFDRIGGQASLLAAGGWVSASETLYELPELETVDGMVDVPEIQVVRGGIRFTRGVAYSNFRGQGFTQTEAQAIAGTAKTFYTVPSVNFVEVRAGVVGLGVTAGILQQKAYPESVARVLRGLVVAHTHDVNANTLTQMATGSTAVSISAAAGAFPSLLHSIELQAWDLRLEHGMADNDVLELVIPSYARAILRKDIANRWNWNLERIPDSVIDQHFADRGVRVQWVRDWQETGLGVAGTPATAWPTTIQYMIYPAGTWVRGLGDVITIDTLYDSVGLGNNNYTALFTEESLLVVMRGFESRVVSVPLTADGSAPAIQQTHAN